MQSRPSDQMTFKAKGIWFVINNSQIKSQTLQNHNNPPKNLQTLQEQHISRHQEKKRNDENNVNMGSVSKQPPWGFQVTLCLVVHAISKNWIMKTMFTLCQMSSERRFSPNLNWFPHFYYLFKLTRISAQGPDPSRDEVHAHIFKNSF